jgi:threonine synthase
MTADDAPPPGEPPVRAGWALTCAACDRSYPDEFAARCAACSGPVLKYRTGPVHYGVDAALPGIWRYTDVLPITRGSADVSLGESGTPLLGAPALAERAGVGRVFLKLDSLCPTGSFKDRAVAAGVEHAVRYGAVGIVCASSGNAAASAAAYAARVGLPAILVVPQWTPAGKLAASAVYGATQVLVPGDYSNSFAVAEQLASALGLANVTTTYLNPHAVVGLRSVAYDLYEQLPVPADAVIVPTSTGPLVHGVATGFDDLVQAGLADRVPRMVAAQPAGCAPITRAFETRAERVTAWGDVDTTVSGLDDPLRGYPEDGSVTLRHLRRTGGTATAMDDHTVEDARDLLRRTQGVFVEPAAATSVAALLELGGTGQLGRTDTVVCLLTGHGMKRMPTDSLQPIRAADGAEAIELLADRRLVGGRTS